MHLVIAGMGTIILLVVLSVSHTLAATLTDTTIYWCPSNTNLPTNNVETLAAAPLSHGAQPPFGTVLYAGAWEHGVYRSADHGATWQPANTGITLPLRVQGGLKVNPAMPA